MHDFLTGAFGDSLFSASPWTIALRIAAAAVLGAAVAWIHARSTPAADGYTMRATLVLLAALIAMVTQVIGDNVARAFSLVGALSIVRFRTVVRDTRDTAFVIFAVAVGMAVGAQAMWVAVMGVVVLGATAILLAARAPKAATGEGDAGEFLLVIRGAADLDIERRAGEILGVHLRERKIHAIRTVKQGLAIDHVFAVTLRENSAPPAELVKILNGLEGVQEVKLLRHGAEEN